MTESQQLQEARELLRQAYSSLFAASVAMKVGRAPDGALDVQHVATNIQTFLQQQPQPREILWEGMLEAQWDQGEPCLGYGGDGFRTTMLSLRKGTYSLPVVIYKPNTENPQ